MIKNILFVSSLMLASSFAHQASAVEASVEEYTYGTSEGVKSVPITFQAINGANLEQVLEGKNRILKILKSFQDNNFVPTLNRLWFRISPLQMRIGDVSDASILLDVAPWSLDVSITASDEQIEKLLLKYFVLTQTGEIK